jgi:PhnB protein
MRRDLLIPQLIVKGGVQAMDFYKRAFGAEEVSRTMAPDKKRLVHGELLLHGHLFYVSDEFDSSEGGTCKSPQTLGGTAVRITVYVENVDKTVDQAVQVGAKVLMPVQDMFWGGRYAKLVDPFGHEWGINQPVTEQTQAETQAAAEKFLSNRS